MRRIRIEPWRRFGASGLTEVPDLSTSPAVTARADQENRSRGWSVARAAECFRAGIAMVRTAPTGSWGSRAAKSDDLALDDGSRVAVVGGGPAGSFFSHFLLDMAEHVGLRVGVDVYEPRDFCRPAPIGCNMCGGIVSEALVQHLATEGINLPETVIQRGIDSYVLHMDVGTVRIETPLNEKRIAAVHRGGGPRDVKVHKWERITEFKSLHLALSPIL